MDTRRHFLTAAGATLAAPMFIPASAFARPGRTGPNDKIGIGLIGTGKRGFELLGPLLNRDDCRVVAVCDVDATRRTAAIGQVDKKYGRSECQHMVDYRELLALKSVDAVVIATPDHWHANQVIHAASAKKDIYCEKPLTYCLHESRAMIGAVRKHRIVFQTGSQQRTEFDHRFVKAVEIVRSGRLGKLISAHVGVGVSSKPCDLPGESPEPGLDWDRWLGPAPMRPYNSVLSPRGVHQHYPSWRLYSEYSGGMMTDFGAHNFDILQWALDMDDSGPVRILPPGDPKSDYGATLIYPNHVEVIHGGPAGVTFTGNDGILHVWRDRLMGIPNSVVDKPLPDDAPKLPRHKSHLDNWFDCIRSRQRPICDVEVGARSNACALLCNLAYWHRENLNWDPKAWEFVGNSEANHWLERERRTGYDLPGS